MTTLCSGQVGSFILVHPIGFEPAAFRVGVIRPSNGNPLRRKEFSRFAQFFGIYGKSPESLRHNDSGSFANSRQIVVSNSSFQPFNQLFCRIHTILCLSLRYRHIGIRRIARLDVKLINISAVPENPLQRRPGGDCLSAQENKAVPLQELPRSFQSQPFRAFSIACWQ